MSEKSKMFRENLDRLVKLFKKFRDKMSKEDYAQIDKNLFGNLDMLINNYDIIKNNFPDEVFEQMGEPLQKMIMEAIDHLKKEVGEIDEEDNNILSDIKHIDDLLKNESLSQSDIDKLLDQRNQIKNNPS